MHCIPYFPVFKESSTTAVRIVYDASAKITSKALSPNDCLNTGPNLIQRLQNMLLTFRSHKITFTADIEKAFLQIELNTQDRDATRFFGSKMSPNQRIIQTIWSSSDSLAYFSEPRRLHTYWMSQYSITSSNKTTGYQKTYNNRHRRTGKILLGGLNIICPNKTCWSQMQKMILSWRQVFFAIPWEHGRSK